MPEVRIVICMTIERRKITRPPAYDHAALAAEAIAHPGEWFTDTDPLFPVLNPAQIRSGQLTAYRPAGAFNARKIDGESVIRFVGMPLSPWDPSGDIPFKDMKRTIDPLLLPDDTPEHIRAALTAAADPWKRRAVEAQHDTPKKTKHKKGKKKKRREDAR